MNIDQYRQFKTLAECREWVEEGYGGARWPRPERTEYHAWMHFNHGFYEAHGYAWRNPNDADDPARGERIARGRALKALAEIVWKADTAQAIWKAQAARAKEYRKAANRIATLLGQDANSPRSFTTMLLDRFVRDLREGKE